TEIKAFVTSDERPVQHTFNYLRGTGGSLYFLRHEEVLEGSEKVSIVVKDEASGVELARIPQVRNVDYTIDYPSGRLLFKSPIPSTMRSDFMSTQINTTQQVLDGNPVLVEVSYDFEGDVIDRGASYGVQARETFFDTFTIGGGIVQEARNPEGDAPDYQLVGGELGLRYTDRTQVAFEYAESQSLTATSLISGDGGLTYDTYSRRNGTFRSGSAWMVVGQAELGDVMLDAEGNARDILSTRAYYQDASAGFFSDGALLEQGQEKWGGEAIWRVNLNNRFRLRHDAVFATVDDLEIPNPDAIKEIERQVTTVQYVYSDDTWRLTTEYNHTFYDDSSRPDGLFTDIIGQEVGYQFTDQLSGFIGQELVLRGDNRIYNEIADQFQTDLGLRYRFQDDWTGEIVESYRWNGANATQIGLTTQMSENTSVYVKERFVTKEDNKGVGTTSIVGGEERFADGTGRMYSEYQVESGIIGERTRAVMGLGKGFKIAQGLTLDVAYERQQIKDKQVVGDSSRDVLSVGWELTRPRSLKFTQKFELRYDNAASSDPQASPCLFDGVLTNPDFCQNNLPGGQDKVQFLTSNNLVLTFWE
ncbi:MAG: hypothetical protein AAFS10_25275, partial [Myxococcota bacterium]